MNDIFSDEPRVFSLPPSASYLDELARGLVEARQARSNPEALADMLIFTPNRRAARELALALYRAVGDTILTPEIRTLGEIGDTDGAAAFDADAPDLPPAMSAAQRRGALARLIGRWRTAAGGEPLPPGALLSAAEELAGLMDQAWMAGGVDWRVLETVAGELAPDLAEHWRSSADFLDIVMRTWPAYLKEQGCCDEEMRRLRAAEALAARWARVPPAHPVLIIGSTGAGAATRTLMKAVMGLPQGLILLPGLDPDPRVADWQSISEAASHPQHVLHATLRYLNLTPDAVLAWPGFTEDGRAIARRRLLNQALAPAAQTRDWTGRLRELAAPAAAAEFVALGLENVSLIEAEDENEEALSAALLLRETLSRPGETAALVTPEASLARRVAAILERWGVSISASSGAPLTHSPTGSLLLLLSRWVFDPGDPARLLALLKHPLVRIGRDAGQLAGLVMDLDRLTLRGARRHTSLSSLAALMSEPPGRTRSEAGLRGLPESRILVQDLDQLFAGVSHAFLKQAFSAPDAAEAIVRLAEALCEGPGCPGERIWSGRSGEAAAMFVGQLRELVSSFGPMEAHDFADILASAMQGQTSPPESPEHPRIVIWGPLEARLQRRHRMILASLNEGSWPKPVAADAFLNRRLRQRLGLPDPDERIGLSAHDFAQLANAPEVILLRARRVADKPAVASRWLWRLRTLAAGGLGGRAEAEAGLAPADDADPLRWARHLRQAHQLCPARPPAPRPPVDKRRLSRFSPSRAASLIRDPYADYAQRILGLERLRRAGEPVDARERGSAVHKAIELFERAGGAGDLGDMIHQELLKAGAAPETAELERPLWLRAARIYLDWISGRRARVVDAELEETARISFHTEAGRTELQATADRIEQLADGSLAIIDFKTGVPKSARQVLSGIEPQLPLEAAIAGQAGFGRISAQPVSELIYFQFSTSAAVMKEANGEPLRLDKPVMDIAEDALSGLKRMISAYSNSAQPYLSRPRVLSVRAFGEYDRLARRSEWTIAEGEE